MFNLKKTRPAIQPNKIQKHSQREQIPVEPKINVVKKNFKLLNLFCDFYLFRQSGGKHKNCVSLDRTLNLVTNLIKYKQKLFEAT